MTSTQAQKETKMNGSTYFQSLSHNELDDYTSFQGALTSKDSADQIKRAVDAGFVIHWSDPNYYVDSDDAGRYWIMTMAGTFIRELTDSNGDIAEDLCQHADDLGTLWGKEFFWSKTTVMIEDLERGNK